MATETGGEQLGGTLAGIIRFIIFVPFGIYFGYASNHWGTIKRHELLYNGPFNHLIAKAERLALNWGKFGFYWNFAIWIPSIVIPPPFSLLFGFVDLAVTVMLSLVTSFQTQVFPHSKHHCKGSGPHTWQLPPGNNESFFEAAARLNSTSTSPKTMCETYVEEWQYGVTLSFFYALIALVNIGCCLVACVRAAREHRQRRSTKEWILTTTMAFPKFIFIILFLIYAIPALFFRCLPVRIKTPIRYARRYTVKAVERLPTLRQIQMQIIPKREEKTRYQGGDAGKPTELAAFLGIYDILMLVVENLHYSDIANLSMTSKSIREAVLPAADYEQRLNHFKLYTCRADSKSQCWICLNQICNDCQDTRSLRQTTPYFHLDVCLPYCNACYYRDILPGRQVSSANGPWCGCAPLTANPNIFQKTWHGPSYYSARQPTKHVPRKICADCNMYPNPLILEMRAQRTRSELKDPNRGQKCNGCQGTIGAGPRWWVCGKCKKECRSFCHIGWGKGQRSGGWRRKKADKGSGVRVEEHEMV